MVKPAIERRRISPAALDRLLSLYGFSTAAVGPSTSSATATAARVVSTVAPMAGGFSGTNYRIEFSDGDRFCLKVCHGYDRSAVESQAVVQDHLRRNGFERACFAIPLLDVDDDDDDGEFRFAAINPDTGEPCLALTFMEGLAADAVVESGAVPEDVVLEGFGRALAEMHAAGSLGLGLGDDDDDNDNRGRRRRRPRHFRTGGACDVQQHIDRVSHDKMEACEHTRFHPYFAEFYPKRLAALVEGMAESSNLPQGVLHGDPFLDNALVDRQTGEFRGFVDFEDATTGPLLFDVACAVVGTCFPEGSSAFDAARFERFAVGYFEVRPLEGLERQWFVRFCRLTLLCNCTWRFINFNVDHREVVECRDRYRELQDRIVMLEGSKTTLAIEKILGELSKARD